MQKIKNAVKTLLKNCKFLYKIVRKIYRFLSKIKYIATNKMKQRKQDKHFSEQVNIAIKSLKEFENEEYIVFYNPTWLGVANSSKGLFENIVPLEHVYNKNDIKKIVKTIRDANIKSVIFSQVCDGWIDIIKKIKEEKDEIKVKVIWHGNCYEFFSDFTWNLNKEVMQLYKDNTIDALAFVRSTMYEFYEKAGFERSYYLQNNVHLEHIEKISKEKSNNVKLGIYNADSRELKNIYTALSAMKLIPNSVADIVPINEGAKKYAKILKLDTTSEDDYITTEELLKRIQENDVNLYPTFTENAPMFPLESFEVGVPCLLGNNNDYFVGTKLGKYVILTKEDDPEYIKERILNCIEHKDEIMKLYREWKIEFDKKCSELVEKFVEG